MKSKSKSKGFTLIELLVVVAIIGVLATIVLSSLNSARSRSRDAKRLSDMKTIQTALEVYHLDHGVYPTISNSWHHSNNSSWGDLETLIGVSLPVDPINESGQANSGAYTYSYHHSSTISCNGQAYMLALNLENKNDVSAGVELCDNNSYGYSNALVVGVGKDGNFVGPEI